MKTCNCKYFVCEHLNDGWIMNSLNQFVNYNWLDLSRNYNSINTTDNFQIFCEYVYVGLKNNVWLPEKFTNGINNKGVK